MDSESDSKEPLSGTPSEVKKDEEFVDNESNEDSVSRKRKRQCNVEMLNWLRNVAKDPCCPTIGSLPERHKWKNYGSELKWKQALLARESVLLTTNVDAKSQQSLWQRKQKMHPSIYNDYERSSSERLRSSQRLISTKDSSQKTQEHLNSQSSSSGFRGDGENTDSTADSPTILSKRREKQVRVGLVFQADVPQFCEASYQSDSKWLGTKTWPLERTEPKISLIERDPIGRGRREICGCQLPGSVECVKFHISEKRMKLKLELGSAFYRWKCHEMGDDVAMAWKKEEEDKFKNIVESNRLTSRKYFWDELFKYFTGKGREALVSYYFNVYLLRRRAFQNRSNSTENDSDDEESEYGPVRNRFGKSAADTPGSIFRSPKKPR